jgi:hypothetical protein
MRALSWTRMMTFALAFALPSVANAGAVYSGDLFQPEGDTGSLICEVLNVGNTTVNGVTINIIESPSTTDTPPGPPTMCGDVGAGRFCQHVTSQHSGHCEAKFSGNGKTLRTTLFVIDSTNKIIAITPAN